jgi:hypothetical protein
MQPGRVIPSSKPVLVALEINREIPLQNVLQNASQVLLRLSTKIELRPGFRLILR